jgi:hypothetical protein
VQGEQEAATTLQRRVDELESGG